MRLKHCLTLATDLLIHESTHVLRAAFQEEAPARLSDLLSTVDGPKRRIILQRMAMHLIPIMEKALVDPVLSHR